MVQGASVRKGEENRKVGRPSRPLPLRSSRRACRNETIQAARRFNIRSTPTMVFPDGRVVPGALEAEAILSLLKEEEAGGTAGPSSGKTEPKK